MREGSFPYSSSEENLEIPSTYPKRKRDSQGRKKRSTEETNSKQSTSSSTHSKANITGILRHVIERVDGGGEYKIELRDVRKDQSAEIEEEKVRIVSLKKNRCRAVRKKAGKKRR